VAPQQSDLMIAKSVSDATPNVGDTITYTVTVTNAGPDDATGVQVTDQLPAGLSFVSATPSQGIYSNVTGVWMVGTVATAVAPTLQIQAMVVSANASTNTATISHSDQFDPDPTNNSGSSTVTPQQSDLALTKTVNDPTPNVGDTVTFTVTLTNKGPDDATNVSVTDALPAGLTLVSSTPSQGSYTGGVWTVGTVSPSSLAPTLIITARVVSPNASTNTAMISHSDQFDPDPGNNNGSSTVTPQQSDLALTKTVNNATPEVGDTITFTITLTNIGPDAATNVTVSDGLPAGLSVVSAAPSQGTYAAGVWTVGTVNPKAVLTLEVTARVVSGNPVTNTARISHSDQFDPDTSNNQATVTETPLKADLSLTKMVNKPQVMFGANVTYTFVIHNLGPNTATGVTVTDPFPGGLVFVSSAPSQGTYNPARGIWTVGTLASGASATLRVTVRVMAMGTIVNMARVSALEFDPVLANNVASATVVGLNPAAMISKRSFLASAF
jgi:uncharacterized repeat protein (TIGR01451 family)